MKLLVCDVEGTIFKSEFRFDESQYASNMWQPLARDLGVEDEENFSHSKWENSRKFPLEIEKHINAFKKELLECLKKTTTDSFDIESIKNIILNKLKETNSCSKEFKLFEKWFKCFIAPMFEKGQTFYKARTTDSLVFLDLIKDDIENDRYIYSSYMDWVDETVKIHQSAPKKLTKKVFDELLNGANYNEGVEDFFANLDRNEYIPILISGGFQELVRRAQRELNIRYGFGACEYSWKPVKKIIDGEEVEIIAGESELDSYFIQPSDFENKFAYLNMFFHDFGLDPTKDWVFVGDGKNDVDIASKAPVSFAISPHEDLAAVSTYTVESFAEIATKLEEIKKHKSPIYVSKNNLFSNKQAVQTFEIKLNEEKLNGQTAVVVDENLEDTTTLLFKSKFKIYTDGKNDNYINKSKQIIETVYPVEKDIKDISIQLRKKYIEIENVDAYKYTYNKTTEISILPSIEKTVIRISKSDVGTPLRLPIAGRKIIEEICFTNIESSQYCDLDVVVYCEGPIEYADFVEAYRPTFLSKINTDKSLNYSFRDKFIQAAGCSFKKIPCANISDLEKTNFDKPIILLDKSMWNSELISSLQSKLLGFALVITFDNSKNDNNTLDFKHFTKKYTDDEFASFSEEDKITLNFLKEHSSEIIGVFYRKEKKELSCFNNPFRKKFKNLYFITKTAQEKSKDISCCEYDETENAYKRKLIKSGEEAFLLSLCSDIFSEYKNEDFDLPNYYTSFVGEIKTTKIESGAKSKFVEERDKATETLYSKYFQKIDFEDATNKIKRMDFNLDDRNNFFGYENYISDGLNIIESYRFFNEQNNEANLEMPLAILQPLFNALELYARAKLLVFFHDKIEEDNLIEELKTQTLGGLCYLFGHIVDSENEIKQPYTQSNNPYFLKKDTWKEYYNRPYYNNILQRYESLSSFFELSKSRGQKIAHNGKGGNYDDIKNNIEIISDAFKCIDEITKLDISNKERSYKECWEFWIDGKKRKNN